MSFIAFAGNQSNDLRIGEDRDILASPRYSFTALHADGKLLQPAASSVALHAR